MIRPEDHDPDLLRVAFLLSKGHAQTQIAEHLSLNPSKVSRLASKAVARGILEPQHPQLMLGTKEVDRIESELHHSATLVAALQRKSGDTCRHVELVYPRSPLSERSSYVREVASGAARYMVREMLPGMRDVGLTWGVGLRELCRELAALIDGAPRSSPLSRQLTFHQCAGDTRAAIDDPSRRAGTMVAELNHLLGTRGHTFSIGASIPSVFDDDRSILRRYFASIPGYSSMFKLNAEHGVELKKDLDAIITGCGDGTGQDSWRDECADAAGIEPESLTRMVVGNVGGTSIANSPRYETAIEDINKRWNGVSTSDLQRAVASGRQVVLVAAEPAKAMVVTRAIELGCVSTLIVSLDLIRKVIELLSPAPAPRADG